MGIISFWFRAHRCYDAQMLKRFSTAVACLCRAHHAIPTLWVMTDVTRLPDPTDVIAALAANSAVIIRHTDAKLRRDLALRVHSLCKAHRVKLFIAEDWRLAAMLGADGVHLPEAKVTSISAGLRITRRTKRMMLTAAAHSERAIRNAKGAKCDAVFVSPVLPTRSHLTAQTLGRVKYAQWARTAHMPVIALGGITPQTLRSLNNTHTSGIAGISFTEK